MNRTLIAIAVLIASVFGIRETAIAQQTAAIVAATEQRAAEPPPSPADIKDLARTLNDPEARAKLIRQLNLLAQEEQVTDTADPTEVGSRALKFLSERVREASAEFGALGNAVIGLPDAARWFHRQLTDPLARIRWIQLSLAVGLVLFGGGAVFASAEWAIVRPRRTIERQKADGASARLWLAVVRFLLGLLPVGLFGAACYLLLPIVDVSANVGVATITIIDAAILILFVRALARLLLSPRVAALRLVPLSGGAAQFLNRWVCLIGTVLVFGWMGISAARLLGMPRIASQAAFKIVGFAVLVMLITMVFQKRTAVARRIRGSREREAGAPSGPDSTTAIRTARYRIAEIWHLLAGAFLVVVFAIWALNIKDGFDFVARGTLVSVLILAIARLVDIGIERLMNPGVALSDETRSRFPHLKERIDRYRPQVRATISVAVWSTAALAMIEVWGVSTFGWFDTATGRAVLARTFSIAFVIVVATIAWELVSAIIERYLVGAVKDGTPVERSQRVRTLLPMLRNAFLIFLIVVVTLIILSEIGLDIAPLLAGAGVVGLAIGFGAQSLVKDIITGVFILFENTIAVGDVVDVGGGHSGLVEAFSVRTIRLRDMSGGVHTVPFSNVTSVVNLTRDYAFYVFNIKIDYGQDTDRVVDVVRALGAELQDDPEFREFILAPIEIIGVDSFGHDAVVLQARFKTKPLRQWAVGREFNRRLKKRFDDLRIALSFPQSVVILPAASKVSPVDGGDFDHPAS